jgi:hypothetical protein
LAYFERANPTNRAKSQVAQQQQQQQQTNFSDAQQPTTLSLDATMGNTLSSYPLLSSIDPSFDPRPSSFLQCLDSEDGLQWMPYSGYIERQHELDESFAEEMCVRESGLLLLLLLLLREL